MYLDFNEKFQTVYSLSEWTIDTISHHFKIPAKCLASVDEGVILVTQKWAENEVGYLLRGSIFFVKVEATCKSPLLAIRGMPKILYGSLYQETVPASVKAERELLSCLDNNSIIFEEKIDGVNIRMYKAMGNYYFATRMKYDGISEKGDFKYGEMAKNLVDLQIPQAYNLVDEGYVPIFEMISPKFDFLATKSKEEKIILIDLMRENKFIGHEEKEKIAKEYNLPVAKLISEIDRNMEREELISEMKKLERYAEELKIEGLVAKSYKKDKNGAQLSDQAFLKIKTQDVRMEHWGAMIPRKFIDESLRNIKTEIEIEEFLNKEKIMEKIIEDLSEDFIIGKEGKKHIEEIYEKERVEIAKSVENKNKALEILKGRRFKDKAELSLATMDQNREVRHWLFKLWKGNV